MIKTKKFIKKNKNNTRKKFKKSKKPKYKIFKKSKKIKLNKIKRKKKFTKKKYKQKGGNILGSIWDNALNIGQGWSDITQLSDIAGTVAKNVISRQVAKKAAKVSTEGEVEASAATSPVAEVSTQAQTVSCGFGKQAAADAATAATAFGTISTIATIGAGAGLGLTAALSHGQNNLRENYKRNKEAIHNSQAIANTSAKQQGNRGGDSGPPQAPPPPKKQPDYVAPGVPIV
tara:strand:- start:38 stop:730 length:693 start_codon:yes stop_codon:yes gene_type:complete